MKEVTGRAKGGVARAKNLTAAERQMIAKRGAAMRWEVKNLPRAVCSSETTPLRIADITLDAYVLEDGTRVLSQSGFLQALGRHKRANYKNSEVPPMLRGVGLQQFINPRLLEKSQPIFFSTLSGLRASGYRAELLPDICEVYLKARDAGTLAPNQRHIAIKADILMRALATVGIIALIDEATGYQDWRAKNALAEILQQYIAKELQPWVRTFPNDFYKNLFRLRGLDFPKDSVKKPQYFGVLTNDIIYKRLAPGVLYELRRVTPRNENGRPTAKYFQSLTTNKGYPALRELLGSVGAIMDFSKDWGEFMNKLNKRHPRFNSQLPLQMEYDADSDNGKGI
jgi:hypothetical protein